MFGALLCAFFFAVTATVGSGARTSTLGSAILYALVVPPVSFTTFVGLVVTALSSRVLSRPTRMAACGTAILLVVAATLAWLYV